MAEQLARVRKQLRRLKERGRVGATEMTESAGRHVPFREKSAASCNIAAEPAGLHGASVGTCCEVLADAAAMASCSGEPVAVLCDGEATTQDADIENEEHKVVGDAGPDRCPTTHEMGKPLPADLAGRLYQRHQQEVTGAVEEKHSTTGCSTSLALHTPAEDASGHATLRRPVTVDNLSKVLKDADALHSFRRCEELPAEASPLKARQWDASEVGQMATSSYVETAALGSTATGGLGQAHPVQRITVGNLDLLFKNGK
jgi:hypothetical protein